MWVHVPRAALNVSRNIRPLPLKQYAQCPSPALEATLAQVHALVGASIFDLFRGACRLMNGKCSHPDLCCRPGKRLITIKLRREQSITLSPANVCSNPIHVRTTASRQSHCNLRVWTHGTTIRGNKVSPCMTMSYFEKVSIASSTFMLCEIPRVFIWSAGCLDRLFYLWCCAEPKPQCQSV